MDEVLKRHIDVICKDLFDDDDGVIVLFGDEGAGKSVLESQMVKRSIQNLKCKFSIKEDVHYFGANYITSSITKPPRSINCLDESRRTLSKYRTMTNTNQNFMDFLSECRSSNQLHFLVLPNYYDLDRDVATRRVKLLIKVVKKRCPRTKKLIRGYFQIIRTNEKNYLKELYKKEYEEIPKHMIAHEGRFDNTWGWDEEEYKKKKESEKAKHYLETEGKVKFGKNDYFVVQSLVNYVRANRIISKVFMGDTASIKRFERLRWKLEKYGSDDDTTP
jgi:GTPase SAR1 family protein